MSCTVRIKQLEHAKGLDLPAYATENSAGVDLTAAVESPVSIAPGEISVIPTGIAIALPDGFETQIRPRSGLAAKFGVTVLNTPGTIDPDYRGEIKVILINLGKQPFVVERGMRIAQMVLAQFENYIWEVNEFDASETERGNNGFGSTGINN